MRLVGPTPCAYCRQPHFRMSVDMPEVAKTPYCSYGCQGKYRMERGLVALPPSRRKKRKTIR